MYKSRLFRLVTLAGVAVLAGCQTDSITNPGTRLALAVGDATNSTPEYGKIKLCKSAASNVGGVFALARLAQGLGANPVFFVTANLAPGICVVIAEDFSGELDGSNVRIGETSLGFASVSGQRIDATGPGGSAVISDLPFLDGGTVFANQFHGVTITYTNRIDLPSGNNGCSHGYWKNHNFPAGYTKDQTFASVFGNNVYGATKTLQQVLKQGGGGLSALGREAVGALLNAKQFSDFEWTPAEVIALFNDAVPGTAAEQEALKDLFESFTDVNGRVCGNPTGR